MNESHRTTSVDRRTVLTSSLALATASLAGCAGSDADANSATTEVIQNRLDDIEPLSTDVSKAPDNHEFPEATQIDIELENTSTEETRVYILYTVFNDTGNKIPLRGDSTHIEPVPATATATAEKVLINAPYDETDHVDLIIRLDPRDQLS